MERVVALNGNEPTVTVVGTPEPEGLLAERIAFHRAQLDADGSFDGEKLLAKTIGGDGTITAFTAPFSTVLALHELTRAGHAAETSRFSLGPVGVNALLENETGLTLWGKRHGRSVGGGAWHVVPSGMYDAGRAPRLMLEQEADEELGLQPSDFALLEPLLVVHVVEELACVQIVYRAVVADDVQLRLNTAEHSELRWVSSPADLYPVIGQGLGIWRACQQVRAHT